MKGNTEPQNATIDDNGNISIGKFIITIHSDAIAKYEREAGEGGFRYKWLTLIEAMASNLVHEAVHTEDENVKQNFENSEKGTENDIEEKPNKEQDKYIREMEELKEIYND